MENAAVRSYPSRSQTLRSCHLYRVTPVMSDHRPVAEARSCNVAVTPAGRTAERHRLFALGSTG